MIFYHFCLILNLSAGLFRSGGGMDKGSSSDALGSEFGLHSIFKYGFLTLPRCQLAPSSQTREWGGLTKNSFRGRNKWGMGTLRKE